jgi:MFS family permease
VTSVRDRTTPDAPAAGGPPPGAAPRSGIAFSTFRSLRHRDYRYLWIGLVFTSSGMWMEQVITGWLVYSMTGSPLLVGVASGLRSLPFLVLGPLAGVAGDRMDRKMLLLRSQTVVLVLYAAMTVVLLLGIEQVWHVFAFTFVTGLAWGPSTSRCARRWCPCWCRATTW